MVPWNLTRTRRQRTEMNSENVSVDCFLCFFDWWTKLRSSYIFYAKIEFILVCSFDFATNYSHRNDPLCLVTKKKVSRLKMDHQCTDPSSLILESNHSFKVVPQSFSDPIWIHRNNQRTMKIEKISIQSLMQSFKTVQPVQDELTFFNDRTSRIISYPLNDQQDR